MYERSRIKYVKTRQILAQTIMANALYDERMWREVAKDLLKRSDMDQAMGALLRTSGKTMDMVSWIDNYRHKLDANAKWDAINIALHAIYGNMLGSHIYSETKSEDERGHFNYVSFGRERFAKMIFELNQHGARFIDVGCGIGDKPFIYWLATGYPASGVEMNDHTYELGKYATHLYSEQVTLIHDNAFNISYENYGIVYMYLPIGSHDKMLDLYRHVHSTMIRGAKLIEVYPREAFDEFVGEKDIHVNYMGEIAVVEV